MKPRHRFYLIVFSAAYRLPHELRDLVYAALAGKAVEKPIAVRRKRMDDEQARRDREKEKERPQPPVS